MSQLQHSVDTPYAVEFEHRKQGSNGAERLLSTDPYSAAIAFVQGEFDISGDLIAAVRELTKSDSAIMIAQVIEEGALEQDEANQFHHR